MNTFAGVNFHYYRCSSCKLVQISPIPSPGLLSEMYDSESYYEDRIEAILPLDEALPGLRFSYKKQIENIPALKETSNLDFGCGDGHFIQSMQQHHIPFNGVEFNPETVENLNTSIPGSSFLTVKDFLADSKTYQLIRMSNVLEHFTDPIAEFSAILDKLETGGYVIIEGPVEMNWSWTNWLKWQYLKLRKRLNAAHTTQHPPTHIIYSNRRNQLSFFKQFPLEVNSFEIKEAFWPFAEKWKDCTGLRSKVIFIFCSAGKMLMFSKHYGNTFLFKAKKI